jgi:hypothetical protein
MLLLFYLMIAAVVVAMFLTAIWFFKREGTIAHNTQRAEEAKPPARGQP